MVAVDNPRPAGRVPGELERGFNCLGAAVAEIHPVQPGRLREQLFGKQARQQGAVELNHVGQRAVEHIAQRPADHRMVAAHGKDAEASQEVGIAVAVGIIEIRTLPPVIDFVEPDRMQHAGQLGVEVAGMQIVSLPIPGSEQAGQVESHACSLPVPAA